jgi:hypothetical protein
MNQVQVVPGQYATNQASGGSTTIAASLPLDVTPGNLVGVFIFYVDSSASTSVRDDLSVDGVRSVQIDWTADGSFLEQWIFKNHGGGPRTFTATFSPAATFRTIHVIEFSGADLYNPVASVASANGSSTTPNAGTVTPPVDGCLIWGTSASGAAPPVAVSPFQKIITESTNFTSSEQLSSGIIGPTAVTWTQANGIWSAVATVLRPAPTLGSPMAPQLRMC